VMTLGAALVLVPLVDLGMKWALRRGLGARAVSLGPLATVQVASGRIWLARFGAASCPRLVWGVWLLAAAPLVFVSWWIPSSLPFVGLLLGGSLSHALEHFRRGGTTDYVHLRFWPAFNLADIVITVGVIGIVARLTVAAWAALG
jgi:signal peptidase II